MLSVSHNAGAAAGDELHAQTITDPAGVVVESPQRDRALDAVRGLAVALMLVDHLALFAGLLPLRLTLGRLALPLFFILAGHLAHRLSPRLGLVALLGVGLTVVAPWAGSPSILVLYVLGVLVLLGFRRVGWSPVLLVAFAVTIYANRYSALGTGYEPVGLVALMALGSMLPRSSFGWASRLPSLFVVIGRRPLTWYVGHVLVLTVLFS